MKTIFYPAIFHPETTGYSVSVPDIEGCFTQGESMEETVSMAKEAVDLMLEDRSELPKPSSAETVQLQREDIMVMVPFNPAEGKFFFIPGDCITSVEELMKCDRIYRMGKVYSAGFFCSWTARYAMQEISAGRLRKVNVYGKRKIKETL